MNKQNEIRSLTWKYFWKQKITEISLGIIGLLLLIFIPYILGHSIGDNMHVGCGVTNEIEECNIIVQWFEGFFYLVVGVMFIFVVIKLLINWITSNWKKANDRAKKDIGGK